MNISKRKSEHVRIALGKPVGFKEKTTGFEHYDFIHCALPEMDFNAVNTAITFLDKTLYFPLMISAVTGGFKGALEINQKLAEACKETGIALGVGSQRQIFENNEHLESFRIVRKTAPEAVIVGNIGGCQIRNVTNIAPFQKIVDLIEADALVVHLNPLQEILQPEGDCQFKGVLKGVQTLVTKLHVPVIVKEIGCGISKAVAQKLVRAGVSYIDIGGAGGTSWAGIESYRIPSNRKAVQFWDWGIPTARSLEMVREVKGVKIIASGGIRDGVTIAKALALGAELCGSALPLLKVLHEKQVEGLISEIRYWHEALKMVLFLTGSRTIDDLRRDRIIVRKAL
jgi:isopentenyl-diphosphate delta-isomerase